VNLFGCKKKEEKGKMMKWRVANGQWPMANTIVQPQAVSHSPLL
jgi:hypothetical protein